MASGALVNLGMVINQTGEVAKITYSAPNTITLLPGSYYILFESLIANANASGDVGASLLVNGVVVPNASQYVSASSTQKQMTLQHSITTLTSAEIQVSNISKVANLYHDTSLFILRLGS